MIPYKEKTFCPFEQCNKFNTCPDALTDSRQSAALKWWGRGNAPISQCMEKPECFEENQDGG